MSGKQIQARRADLDVKNLDGEVVVYDRRVDLAHCLGGLTAFVFTATEQPQDDADLARSASKALGRIVTESELNEAVEALAGADLLLADNIDLGRRAMLGKAAVGAGMAVGVGLITLAAPSPAQAQSGVVGGGAGGGGSVEGEGEEEGY